LLGLQKRYHTFSEDYENQLFKNKAKILPDEKYFQMHAGMIPVRTILFI